MDRVAFRYHLDPMHVWKTWTFRQIVLGARLANREDWRQQAWQIVLAGGQAPHEPAWDLDGSRARYYREQFEAVKRLREEQGRG